jgi:hypothetical protein
VPEPGDVTDGWGWVTSRQTMATQRGRSRFCGRCWPRCGGRVEPDYSPKLAQIEQALEAIIERLEAVEHEPGMYAGGPEVTSELPDETGR